MENVNNQGQDNSNLGNNEGENNQDLNDNTNLPSDKSNELSPEQIIEKLKEERDRALKDHSELEKLMGKKGNEEGQRKIAEKEAQQAKELADKQAEFYDTGLGEFVNNGMNITDEVKTQIEELGISELELKVKAYEHKDKLVSLYSQAGSEEAYKEIMTWAKDNIQLSKEQLAIEGLKNLYIKEIQSTKGDIQTSSNRVEGSGSVPRARGYETQGELMADLRYVKNNPNDLGAREKYEKKKALTSQKVITGY